MGKQIFKLHVRTKAEQASYFANKIIEMKKQIAEARGIIKDFAVCPCCMDDEEKLVDGHLPDCKLKLWLSRNSK